MNVDTLIDAPDKSLDYINHMGIPHFRELAGDTGRDNTCPRGLLVPLNPQLWVCTVQYPKIGLFR
jgi:hypothetical protein